MEADSHLLSLCLQFRKTSGVEGGHEGQDLPIIATLRRVRPRGVSCTGVLQHHQAPFGAAVVSDCTSHPLLREDKSRDGHGSVSLELYVPTLVKHSRQTWDSISHTRAPEE